MEIKQNYNEFKTWMRWFDYVNIMLFEFPFLLIRRYDWMDTEKSTYMVQVFGIKVYQVIKWK